MKTHCWILFYTISLKESDDVEKASHHSSGEESDQESQSKKSAKDHHSKKTSQRHGKAQSSDEEEEEKTEEEKQQDLVSFGISAKCSCTGCLCNVSGISSSLRVLKNVLFILQGLAYNVTCRVLQSNLTSFSVNDT